MNQSRNAVAPSDTHQDRSLTCKGCRTPFLFTAGEQEFYASRGLNDPARCRPCRQKRREEQERSSNANSPPSPPTTVAKTSRTDSAFAGVEVQHRRTFGAREGKSRRYERDDDDRY